METRQVIQASASDLSTANPPDVLGGRYRILALLGTGGMGSVYRVHDLELDEVVALKIVGPLDPFALARFRDEVRLARRVTHPNVARTFDIGEHGEVRFLTMEYVAGDSLRRMLAREDLAEPTTRQVARAICEACIAIHEADVIHGDLKPENVVVSSAGRVKVSDFGLATIRGGDAAHGGGTALYMAPEQHRGAPADQRSDLYALGIILHELFAGKRPTGAVPSLRLPPDVRGIVARCLDPDPARRPCSARDVLAALGTGPRATRPERDAIVVAVHCLAADEPRDRYLGAAIAGDLVRALGTSHQLAILAQPVAPGARVDGVDAIVEGHVRRTGDQLQLALRVVSQRDGYLLWGRTMTVDLVDVIATTETAARVIADALGARTTARTASTIRDPRLIELYLKARDRDHATFDDHDTDNAELYREILDEAPDDPLILASYARALIPRGLREPGAIARAQVIAERAIAIAPELAEAQLAVGLRLFIGNDAVGAIRAIVRGLALAPSSAFGQGLLGHAMCELGELERGLAHVDFALTLEPDHPMVWANAFRYAHLAGRDDRATALLERAPRLSTIGSSWMYWVTRARVAIGGGEETAVRLSDDLAAARAGGLPLLSPLIPALRGRMSATELRAALMPFFVGDPENHRARACGNEFGAELALHLGLGDEARRYLEASDAHGVCDLLWLERCPGLAPLRDEPWFVAHHHRVALRAERAADALAEATGINLGDMRAPERRPSRRG